MDTDRKRIVLAGGSGFLGSALAKELSARNYEVVVLARTPKARTDGVREFEWDGKNLGEWIQFLDGAEAVVNLTGRSVNCHHTPENLREIIESRVNSVNAITTAIYHATKPPRSWVQSGSLAIYGDRGDEWCDEQFVSQPGTAVEICQAWENAFNFAPAPKTRKVLLRIGFVLARDGGALSVLGKLTKRCLGGTAGNGRQFVSWIHIADMNRMFIEAIERDDLSGVFNASGPSPVTNREFMREMRRALRRPWSPPAPAWAVRFGSRLLQTEASLALTGRRCAPMRFLESGFIFQFPDLRAALTDIYPQN
jgi:uncharacterized protein (TIGR01777 family)